MERTSDLSVKLGNLHFYLCLHGFNHSTSCTLTQCVVMQRVRCSVIKLMSCFVSTHYTQSQPNCAYHNFKA